MYSLQGIRSISLVGIFGVAALVTLASPQTAGAGPLSPVLGVLPDAPADGVMTLLPSRSTDTIRRDLETAQGLEREAAGDRATSEERLSEAKAKITVCKSEVDVIKARVALAKEQENETEQADLDRQIKEKELQLKALEARKNMREAERDLADTRLKAAQALGGFLKKERQLSDKRDDLAEMSTSGEQSTDPVVLARLQTEIRDVERQCLEMLKDVTEKQKNVADREKSLLDRRLKLHHAQRDFLAGPE